MDRCGAPVLAGTSVKRTEGHSEAQELPTFGPCDRFEFQSGDLRLFEVEHPGDSGIAQRPRAQRLAYRRERPTSLRRHASTSGRTPPAHVGEDVLVVPGDLIAGRLVHVDERELRPSRMLCDLISLAREHELEIPVVLGPIHIGEYVRSGEGLGGNPDLFIQDQLRGPMRRFAQHQVRRREHPTLAVHLGPLGIEGPDVVPRSARIEVPHEDSFRMTGLADHQERGEANASLRDLSRLQGSVARGETGELSFGRHGHASSSVGFQPSSDLRGRRGERDAPPSLQRFETPRSFISFPHLRGRHMARNLYFLGTAGSGKSTMVFAFQLWMNSQGLDCITVNLDPGAEALQYSPDLDVRDYVNIEEIMTEQGLGPNGAQVAAADMVAMNAKELADVLETFETNYVLIDTPGQIELFTFRASGPVLIDAFGREDAALVYLNDPALVRNPGGFISSVLLNATVQFRHSLPFINVLSKADLLPEAELERIVKWSVDPFALYEALFEEAATAKTLLDVEFLKSLETIGVYRRVHPVSSEITFGFEEIYSQVQLAFEGGEDLSKD